MIGKVIGQGTRPMVCTPLVGENYEQLMEQLQQVLEKKPDIIEWRADFFTDLADTKAVLKVADAIKKSAGSMPILFTIRSKQEGGQPTTLTAKNIIELDAEVCRKTNIEYVDCELSTSPDLIKYLRKVSLDTKTKIVGSFHNFNFTPSHEEIVSKLAEAEKQNFDVAKVAVMPQRLEDVLTLLGATLEAKQKLSIPLITMSMGKYGAISRMVGGVFGSSLSFAVGSKSSAPGQVPIKDLNIVLDIMNRTLNG